MRFLPADGALVEVTLRTIHGRFLLRPSRALNERVIGVIGRAQRKYGMRIHALVFLSNHAHALLSPDSAQQLAAFMDFVASNVAREIGRLHDWREKFWGRRYRSILVSHEEKAQADRLAYLLSHGVKEGLVVRPQDWPGVQCVRALLEGTVLEGTWFDRTAEYRARLRGEGVRPSDYAEPERIELSPLPCWSELDAMAHRRKVAELVEGIAERRRAGGVRPVLGHRAIVDQHPHDKPLVCDRSPAPAVHAASKPIRLMMRIAYWRFLADFREAAYRLRRGDLSVRFPLGAFPPPMPCVVPTG